MSTLILRSLRAHRARLTLTVVAIALSVSFVTASFVLADSLRSVFGDVSAEIYDGVDAEIRAGTGTYDTVETGRRFDASSVAEIDTIDGIAEVVPVLGGENVVFTVGPSGEVLRQTGPPTLVFSTFGDSPASPFSTMTGRPPGPGEVMLDTAQARALDVADGDPVLVAGPNGTDEYTLSGTIVFGDAESGVSPYFLLFDLTTTQDILGASGQVDSVSVVLADGVALADVLPSIEAHLRAPLFVADQSALVAEQFAEFGEVIDLIQTALLVFAAITLFVSTFVIANTFAVIVGQRRRQIGLLRAVGARAGQTTRLVLAEAAAIGLIASALGLFGGLGIAEAIKALVAAVTDGGFPDGPIRVLPRTVAIGALLGVGVTAASAFLPAHRAGRVAPLEAMRPDDGSTVDVGTRGIAHRMLFATLGRLGASGRLAATGVARNPRRVVTTSMSMIVGLALIGSMTVLASSYRSTLRDAVTAGFAADFVITGQEGVSVPFDVVSSMSDIPGVRAASGYGTTEVLHDGDVTTIAGYSSTDADAIVFDVIEGGSGRLDDDLAYVSVDFADGNGLAVGDVFPVEFSDGYVAELSVQAVIDESSVIDASVVVGAELVGSHARNRDAELAAIRFDEGVNLDRARSAVAAAVRDHPQLDVSSMTEHLGDRQAQVDQLLALVNGLLTLTIVVALTGIANTIALSLLERRHELGLLRAVGMSRRQLRRMVRLEALTLSGFGAVIGTVVGVGAAIFAIRFVPDDFVRSATIPAGSLATYAAVCIAFGVLSAGVPARRAARLDVVAAVADPG